MNIHNRNVFGKYNRDRDRDIERERNVCEMVLYEGIVFADQCKHIAYLVVYFIFCTHKIEKALVRSTMEFSHKII